MFSFLSTGTRYLQPQQYTVVLFLTTFHLHAGRRSHVLRHRQHLVWTRRERGQARPVTGPSPTDVTKSLRAGTVGPSPCLKRAGKDD
eukprot:3749480-Rhodomonas_salina.1